MIKVSLSESEKNRLIEEIEKEKSNLPILVLYAFAIAVLITFLSGKHRQPSLYSEYGFLKPALIITIFVSSLCYVGYKNKTKALKNDLDLGEKIVESNVIWKKEKSFISDKYCIHTDSNYKDFKKFDIEEGAYNKIVKGHIVILEYAEKSKYLFQFDLNLKKEDPSV